MCYSIDKKTKARIGYKVVMFNSFDKKYFSLYSENLIRRGAVPKRARNKSNIIYSPKCVGRMVAYKNKEDAVRFLNCFYSSKLLRVVFGGDVRIGKDQKYTFLSPKTVPVISGTELKSFKEIKV